MYVQQQKNMRLETKPTYTSATCQSVRDHKTGAVKVNVIRMHSSLTLIRTLPIVSQTGISSSGYQRLACLHHPVC